MYSLYYPTPSTVKNLFFLLIIFYIWFITIRTITKELLEIQLFDTIKTLTYSLFLTAFIMLIWLLVITKY